MLSKWFLVVLLGLQAHFAVSYLVPLDEQSQREFGGLLRWFWPWAYGDRLRLSNIAVVLAFVVGAAVAGVIGALIALPVAAVYPAVERIWLREKLPEETVVEHKRIEQRKAG